MLIVITLILDAATCCLRVSTLRDMLSRFTLMLPAAAAGVVVYAASFRHFFMMPSR